MDYHPTNGRRKRESSKHGSFFVESRQNYNMDDNSHSKRRRRSIIDCNELYETEEASKMIDILTSRRMRILLREKPWHNHTNSGTPTLSTKDNQQLQEFKEKQKNIQLQMADEAFSQWKNWCSLYTEPFDSSITLQKLINFIGTKVIPQENAVLRQLAQDDRIPVSSVESLILPLLRLLRQEEESLVKIPSQSSHSQMPLIVSIQTGQNYDSRLPMVQPSDRPSSLCPKADDLRYVSLANQAAAKVNSEMEDDDKKQKKEEEEEEEEEEVSSWTSVKAIRERSPEVVSSSSAVLDDVSCLENSLEIVSTMTAEVESLRKAACVPIVDFTESNPYLLTDSFFARLRKDQAKAERLGLNGTLYNSLLVEVLQEHVQLVQTLSIQMSNRVISLVPTSLVKYPISLEPVVSTLPSVAPKESAHKQILKTRSDRNVFSPLDVSYKGKTQDHLIKSKDNIDPIAASMTSEPDSKDKTGDQIDKVKADDDSVRLIWQRWRIGEDGMQPLQELVNRQSTDKMASALRTYCTTAYHLSNEIERLCGKGMDVDTAIQSLETRRHLSLQALAMTIFKEEEQRQRGEERAISGSIQQASISSTGSADKMFMKGVESSDYSRAAQTSSTHEISLDLFENPASELSTVGRSLRPGSHTCSIRSSLTQWSPKMANGSSQMITSMAGCLTAPAATMPSSASSMALPGTVGIGLPVESSVGSLRSTFETLAAMNTTKSTLGPTFIQLRTSKQLSINLQGVQDLSPLPGSLTASLADNAYHSSLASSFAGPVLTTAPTTSQGAFISTAQQSTLATISKSHIQNDHPSTSRNTQSSTIHIPAQPLAQQQQPQSTVVPQTPISFIYPSSLEDPAYSTSMSMSSSEPGPSTQAASQGVFQLLRAAESRGTALAANMAPMASSTTLSSSSSTLVMSHQSIINPTQGTAIFVPSPTTSTAQGISAPSTCTTLPTSLSATKQTSTITAIDIRPPTSAAAAEASTAIVVPLQSEGIALSPQMPSQVNKIVAAQATLTAAPMKTSRVAVSSPSTSFISATETTTLRHSATDGLKEQIRFYRIDIELHTVFEIWDLWTLGIRGCLSVTDLIGKHKMEWLHQADREIYRDYRSVLLTLERAVRLFKIDVRVGLERLEKVRIDFKMTVRQFAKVLTEVDAGKVPAGSILMPSPSSYSSESIQDFAAAIAGLTLPHP
ncbi:hypothetical protein BGX24_004955 [Mortierella sp. AD032]|nr:hypothetical protein BGX24_004955 [Mortierella sp. AD032]